MGGNTDAGSRLRSARQRAGLSQVETAFRAGMARQHVYAYEMGKTASLDTLLRLATAIGADPHEIDPRLCPVHAGPTLNLVFAAAPDGRAGLVGETKADDGLVRELVPVRAVDPAWYVDRTNLEKLIQAAGERKVRLVIRADLPPRELPPAPQPARPAPKPKRPKAKKGGAKAGG